jgi:hypothetical protein
MNIELLGRQAIDRIKSEWGLPRRGFVAGGALANIIWEIVSGNKAKVNDIDIFVFDKVIDKIDDSTESLFDYQEKDFNYYEDYTGLSFKAINNKDFYTIIESDRDGIFNIISYRSNSNDPNLILKSFDINCTSVGYLIEEDRFYWTKDFEEFLKTGELKIVNIMTPSHTAIRLAKKAKELNTMYDEFEFNLVKFILNRNFLDVIKLRFKQRYYDMYQDNIEVLEPLFLVKRDDDLEKNIKEKYGVVDKLYYLQINNHDEVINHESGEFGSHGTYIPFTDDDNLNYIYRTSDFLFYMRNIYNKPELKSLWKEIYYFWEDASYIDKEVSSEDISLLSRFARNAPLSINNLKGMKISEQIEIIKKFFNKFKDDPIIAISILENVKVTKDIELDDDTALILELSVRKRMSNDINGKVRKILNIGNDNNSSSQEFTF